MANYWITLHDPHKPGDEWRVYRQVESGVRPIPQDRVLFYEVAGEDGTGASALVCAARVTGEIRKRVPVDKKWPFEIPCSAPERAVTAVRSRDMLVAIESPERTPLNTWRGLKKIEKRHYDVLRELIGLPPEMT